MESGGWRPGGGADERQFWCQRSQRSRPSNRVPRAPAAAPIAPGLRRRRRPKFYDAVLRRDTTRYRNSSLLEVFHRHPRSLQWPRAVCRRTWEMQFPAMGAPITKSPKSREAVPNSIDEGTKASGIARHMRLEQTRRVRAARRLRPPTKRIKRRRRRAEAHITNSVLDEL